MSVWSVCFFFIYYASSSPNDPKYDQLVIVGVDATGKDVFTTLKLGTSVQKSGFAQEDAEEEKADAVYYTQRSNKADIETCPKMCDVESPLMPEDGR